MTRIAGDDELRSMIDHLVCREPRFAPVVQRHGVPALRRSKPGLESLLRIVTDQLISLKAGAAIWRRLETHLAPFEPDRIARCSVSELRGLGLSGAKARTFIAAAAAFCGPEFSDANMACLPDDELARLLMTVKGVGSWTTDIYLLSAVQSADAWPATDLALQVAAAHLLDLPGRPDGRVMALIAEPWRPYRAVAARLLWSHYRGLKGMTQAVS
jgi:DNA-3-methyladenine glycosylase II